MITTNDVLDLILAKANIKTLDTDKDIQNLSEKVRIYLQEDAALSINTWKRLYGRLDRKPGHKFAPGTLQTIARYLGYDSWKELDENIDNARKKCTCAGSDNSEFISNTDRLKMLSISKNDIICITYSPKRMVEAEYLGNYRYRVMNSSNSKLQHNDTFTAYDFTKGDSFRAYDVKRNGHCIGCYISGESHDIESFNIKRAQDISRVIGI